MMHFITRKVEGLEARQGTSEPEEDAVELRLDEVEQRVTAVEVRVDRLVADYEAADDVLSER